MSCSFPFLFNLKDKVNIAVLASYKIYPAVSGGQKGIALFYKYLSQLLPVTLLTVTGNEKPDGANIKCIDMLGSSKLRYINPFLFFKIRKFIKQHEITHLVLEHPYYGWLGRLLKTFCKVRLVVHSHNIEALRFKSMKKWWWGILWNYEKHTHGSADINFFITQTDLDYAIKNFHLKESKCHLITYGTEINTIPSQEERAAARKVIASAHDIADTDTIILFNGFFDYQPNLTAVDVILEKINPLFQQQPGFSYKLIICGKNLPPSYNNLKDFADKNIIYPGFVPDIKPYFIGADIFINPIVNGGGIKTKLVEALSYNLSSVSTKSGAIGIPAETTIDKMITVNDDDAASFCDAILSIDKHINTGAAFFEHFYWGSIAEKAKNIICAKQQNK